MKETYRYRRKFDKENRCPTCRETLAIDKAHSEICGTSLYPPYVHGKISYWCKICGYRKAGWSIL